MTIYCAGEAWTAQRKDERAMGDYKATVRGAQGVAAGLIGTIVYGRKVATAWAMSEDEFWLYQATEFRRMYDYARRCVPYYRNRSGDYPPAPVLRTRDELLAFLGELPILTRDEVRAHNAALWRPGPAALFREGRTSGTTGTPLRLRRDLRDICLTEAILADWHHRLCGSRWPRTLRLSGMLVPSGDGDLFWRDWAGGGGYASIYDLSPCNAEAYARLVKSVRPQVIWGYASAVYELTRVLGGAAQKGKSERIALVTSEVLQPHWRETIEASLCRRVFDFYGAQEQCLLVLECQEGSMHIHPMQGIVELLNGSQQPAAADELGDVVVTGLGGRGMPLIRYAIGDMAQSTAYWARCPCGLGWPVIGRIEGRSEDMVRTRDGRRVGYLCFHATKYLEGIREAQLVQTDYEEFIFNIVLDPLARADTADIEAVIRSQLSQRLQTDVAVVFRYLDAVPRGAQGKFQAVRVDFGGSGE